MKIALLVFYFGGLLVSSYWYFSKIGTDTFDTLKLSDRVAVRFKRLVGAVLFSAVFGGLLLLGMSKELASIKYLFGG